MATLTDSQQEPVVLVSVLALFSPSRAPTSGLLRFLRNYPATLEVRAARNDGALEVVFSCKATLERFLNILSLSSTSCHGPRERPFRVHV